jgi:hypothetical protein
MASGMYACVNVCECVFVCICGTEGHRWMASLCAGCVFVRVNYMEM